MVVYLGVRRRARSWWLVEMVKGVAASKWRVEVSRRGPGASGRDGRCGGVAEKEAGRQGAGTFSRARQERALPLVVALGRDGRRGGGVIAECCDCIVQSLHCAIRSGGGVSPGAGARGRAGRASSRKRERACVVVVYPGVNWRAGRCRPR